MATLEELARQLSDARKAELEALAALRLAAREMIPSGQETEVGFAKRTGINRSTVRSWLGK